MMCVSHGGLRLRMDSQDMSFEWHVQEIVLHQGPEIFNSLLQLRNVSYDDKSEFKV